jgi:hypothetical protein
MVALGALELSRQYFFDVADSRLKQEFPSLYPRLAVGLVGNGSDRFGFDDEISQDHDWGVDFYVWVTEADRDSLDALQEWKTQIFASYPPSTIKESSQYCLAVTPMTAGDFYRQLIGTSSVPETLDAWIRIPEENLALATNGEVWFDGTGEFTHMRMALLDYFPEDLRLKRMAARCMEIAQTGQYNHLRMAKREDWVTVQLILAHFTEAVLALTFLLNKVYQPYYKWGYRRLAELPLLGRELKDPLERLATSPGFDREALTEQKKNIEFICKTLATEIRRQGLASSTDWFMTSLGEEIQRSIGTERLRRLPAQYQV